jgi:hypothetical protein
VYCSVCQKAALGALPSQLLALAKSKILFAFSNTNTKGTTPSLTIIDFSADRALSIVRLGRQFAGLSAESKVRRQPAEFSSACRGHQI